MDMDWLEISLEVSPELAEAVSDVLARFVPDGLAVEATAFAVTEDDHGYAVGPVRVKGYLPAGDQLDTLKKTIEEALWHLGQIASLPEPTYTPIQNTNWNESWKQNFKPLRIGKRIMVVPAWLNPPLQAGDVEIRLDPGMAFGTGTHPTTQLCLASTEQLLGRYVPPGSPVIDLGTGSGILAIAAAKLSSGPVRAVDVDADAVRVATENVLVNGVADTVHVSVGSLADLLAEQAAAPLVLVNILARVIINLFGDGLARLVTPGGYMVLSGILDTQAYEVIATLKEHGLELRGQEQIDDWVALIATRPAD